MSTDLRLGVRVFAGLCGTGAIFVSLWAIMLAGFGGWSPATRLELLAGAAAWAVLDVVLVRVTLLGSPFTRRQCWVSVAASACLIAIVVGFFAGYVWTDYQS